jgi:glutamyl-Q tRNA(Asp) synthetase
MMSPYTGRFAPSPTGPLHAGSLAAALASWLDARAHGGRWLVRIEDIDAPRCVAGAEATILTQLAGCGLVPDAPPLRQSTRGAAYATALEALLASGAAYPCGCTRREIEGALLAQGSAHSRHAERVYPGTCRDGLHGRARRAVRLRTLARDGSDAIVRWRDRRLGAQEQNVTRAVGDFVLRRADGLWAYQLAVVVDDAAQGVTHVVRGEDLADNSARQMLLQARLGLAAPHYLHTPLVRAADGEKLSKGHGACAVVPGVAALRHALRVLGSEVDAATCGELLAQGVAAWRERWGMIDGSSPPPEIVAMHTTPSGLQYEDTSPGQGAAAQAGQTVTVHYTGWLYENGQAGAKFDSSKDRKDPFEFALGAGAVIAGWDEGVQGMKVGGTRRLVIPPALGYGARGAGRVIPPNATLLFEVELLSV